jgi:excisionase family DNA binding protein
MKTSENVQDRIGPDRTPYGNVYSDRLLTLEQTAERLAVSLPTLRAWVWKRKIEVVRIGRCVRIREKVIRELIARNTCPARGES